MSGTVLRVLLVAVLLTCAAARYGAAEVVSHVIGEKDGWRQIALMRNIERISGKRGYDDLRVAESRAVGVGARDLLLTFDRPGVTVNSRYYRARGPGVLRGKPYYGSASGLFTYGQQLIIDTLPGSLFSDAEDGNGFAIDFWLLGGDNGDHEQLLRWASTSDDNELRQEIALTIEDGRAVWRVNNILFDADGEGRTFTLTGATRLDPTAWQRHLLRYDPRRAALAYYIDGALHDIGYATDSATEDGVPFAKRIAGGRGLLTIGGRFSGALDHLLISSIGAASSGVADGIGADGGAAADGNRRGGGSGRDNGVPHAGGIPSTVDTPPTTDRYVQDDAIAESEVIDLGDNSGRIIDIGYDAAIPPHGEVVIMYKLFASMTEALRRDEVEWRAADSGVAFTSDVYAKYLQLRLVLRADRLNNRSPVLSNVAVRIDRLTAPLPARSVTVIPRAGGRIAIEWQHPIDLNPTHYRVVYGTVPNHFTNSVDVGNDTAIILDSLAENTLYYIRVDSYRNEIPEFRNARGAVMSERTGN